MYEGGGRGDSVKKGEGEGMRRGAKWRKGEGCQSEGEGKGI